MEGDAGPRARKTDPPTHLLCLFEVFKVEFKERLDVVAREGDGHEEDVVVFLLCHPFDGVARLGAQPGRRPDLGLPDEPVRVAVP